MCNVTHNLLVIGKDVMRLPFTTMCYVTHSLLFTRKIAMKVPFTNMQCHLQTVGHSKRCDETAFHKMCNAAHKLLIIGKDVMNLPQNVKSHSLAVGHSR